MACKINANLSGIDGKAIKIFNFFVEKGLSVEQACAICGNVSKESSYDERAVNPTSGAFGLFQFLPKYSQDLQKSPQKNSFDFQLDYCWKKYNAHKRYGDSNKGSAMWKKWHTTELREYFKQGKGTLDDYVELWMCAFERCGVSEAGLQKRKAEAKRILELYNKYTSGECAKIDAGSVANGSANPDTSNVTNSNGAVLDVTTASIDCPANITINGVVSGTDSESSNNESSGTLSGFSDQVRNPKMKKVLSDVSYFINLGEKTAKCPYPPGSKVPEKPCGYMGKCTYGPTTWYGNAGISLYFWCGEKKTPWLKATPECVRKRMAGHQFYCVWHGDFADAKALPESSFRPGDVATILAVNGGHGLMWTGKDWRSDCIERYGLMSAFRNSKSGRAGNFSVMIWRRQDCQEEGYTVKEVW